MNISEKLTQQNLQEIMKGIYKKGQEAEDINVVEIIEEIKQLVMTYTTK